MRLIPYISFEVTYTNVLENIIQINIILLLLYEIVGEMFMGSWLLIKYAKTFLPLSLGGIVFSELCQCWILWFRIIFVLSPF